MGSLSQLLLGLIWTAVAVVKAVYPAGLAEYTANLLKVPTDMGREVAWAVVGLELALGAGLLCALGPLRRLRTALGWSALLAGLAVGVYVAAEPVGALECGCFGAVLEATRSRRLILAAVIVFLAAGMLRKTHADGVAERAGAGLVPLRRDG